MDMCGMMLIDMHGVRYANNLLKNPATKRLSGKKIFQKSGDRVYSQELWNTVALFFRCFFLLGAFVFLLFLFRGMFSRFSRGFGMLVVTSLLYLRDMRNEKPRKIRKQKNKSFGISDRKSLIRKGRTL